MKGHQDKNEPHNKLTLQAQLNVDADKLADGFTSDNPNLEYSTSCLMSHTGALLHLTQGTLTHKLKRSLCMERTAPPLLAKLCKKFGWSEATAADANWEACRLALGRLRQHKVTLIKHFLNHIAPLGWLVHIHDPKCPKGCPCCNHHTETREHLHQCSGPGRLAWRDQFVIDLVQALEKQNSAADLKQLLVEGLRSVLEGRDPETIQVPDTAAAAAVFEAQSAIGWHVHHAKSSRKLSSSC